ERQIAARARVDTDAFFVIERAAKRRLRALFAQNIVLFRRQQFAPLFFGVLDLEMLLTGRCAARSQRYRRHCCGREKSASGHGWGPPFRSAEDTFGLFNRMHARAPTRPGRRPAASSPR